MPKYNSSLSSLKKKLRYRSAEFNIEPLKVWLEKICEYDMASLDDLSLKKISQELITQARSGVPLNDLLVKAYALVREAAYRVLGMKPFDVQVIGGIAMHDGGIVEMQTGEGKTLTAVFPAYLNALSGKGVHVLTFNDYLAQRDAQWMGPLYRFLGLSVGYVCEGMPAEERRRAYNCGITYLTAKEAGFDYLRSFLAQSASELVQRPFNFAIIDEADSILIDEARIPLVIAGRTAAERTARKDLPGIIRSMAAGEDYETDEYERNVYLTEQGLNRLEQILKCGNLYDDRNIGLLVDINNALHAEVLLKRDVDYIVRNGRVELIDEFTGRVADKRHWPYGLQEAVEAKEGITPEDKGQILASITLQNFIRLYPRSCGMTGTALPSADEFLEFYGLKVVVIPTNRPCIRVDHPDLVFTHREAKYKALIDEIVNVHKTGRPILIGTGSVEESELLASRLKAAGVECRVLNAKNDELEAKIIAQAGAVGAVTVSTNMAGRGTDIRLGGENEEERDRVVELGGLYVIGTNHHESSRIDYQLRGRAGRQGDPGSTRFFISFDDDLMQRYKVKELIPQTLMPKNQEKPLDNPVFGREIARVQRIIEGQNFDIRRTLNKYSVVIERQRQAVFAWRLGLLLRQVKPQLMAQRLPGRYHELLERVGKTGLERAERQVTLYFINKCWADYLDYVSYIRESIHLVNIGGKIPVHEFNKTAIFAYENLKAEITDAVTGMLSSVEITENGVDMKKAGMNAPSSTWTYLVNDSPEQAGISQLCLNPALAVAMWPLMLGTAIYARFFKRRRAVK